MVVLATGLEPNYQAVERTVLTATAAATGSDAQAGKETFVRLRSACHGASGESPAIVNEGSRKNLHQVIAFVKNPAAPMAKLYPTPLNNEDVR